MEVDNCRLGYVAALDLLMFKRVLPFQIFLFAASLIGTWNE